MVSAEPIRSNHKVDSGMDDPDPTLPLAVSKDGGIKATIDRLLPVVRMRLLFRRSGKIRFLAEHCRFVLETLRLDDRGDWYWYLAAAAP